MTYQVLAKTADPSPDGNGVFGDDFGLPVLNNAGQAAFYAKMLATSNAGPIDDFGLFRADVAEVVTMVRGGQPSAHGNLLDIQPLFYGFSQLTPRLFGIDNIGRLGFLGVDDQNMDAVYRTDGTTLETILQAEQNTAFGDDLRLGPAAQSFIVNNQGQMSYQVQAFTPASKIFLIRSDETSNQVLFELDQALPDGEQLLGFRSYAMNHLGEVVSRLNTSNDTFGYYVTDGSSTRKLMHTGEAAVDSLGSFTINLLIPPDINALGEAVLMLFVDDIMTDYSGLFLHDTLGLAELNRTGEATATGALTGFAGKPIINDNGTIAYLRATEQNAMELVTRRNGNDIVVARTGEQLPDPIGLFVEPSSLLLNQQDQMLFLARSQEPGLPEFSALFFYDPQFGIALVARPGQTFRGDVLTSVEAALPASQLFETHGTSRNAQNGLNDAGQVAFRYTLTNGEKGIALATVEFTRDDLLFSDGFES